MSGQSDQLALLYIFPAYNLDRIQVGVERLPAVSMIYDDHVAITQIIIIPAGENDYPGINGYNRRIQGSGYINRWMG